LPLLGVRYILAAVWAVLEVTLDAGALVAVDAAGEITAKGLIGDVLIVRRRRILQ
jgi:hypothetical protein